jgi:uncharacterized protein YcbX/energy-converting hydrogenase Eha subunit A
MSVVMLMPVVMVTVMVRVMAVVRVIVVVVAVIVVAVIVVIVVPVIARRVVARAAFGRGAAVPEGVVVVGVPVVRHLVIVSRSPGQQEPCVVCDREPMHVESIAFYPVKGCRRVEVARAEVEPWGLAGDRRWLVVDAATGVAITLRDTTAMVGIQPVPRPGGLVLRAPGLPDLTVDEPRDHELIEVKVWGFAGPAMRAGDEADGWLTRALARQVRLVFLDDPTRRAVDPDFGTAVDRVSFADDYPVSLANLGSLAALNDAILDADPAAEPLPVTRFRPNLVVAEAAVWVEDGWVGGRLRVGEVTFRVPKPIDRCVVTTTDQETGVKGHEPLRTLGRIRNVNQGLLFCLHLIPDGRGQVAVGDPVVPL